MIKQPPLSSSNPQYKVSCSNGDTFYFQSLEEAKRWIQLNNRPGLIQERRIEYFSFPLGEKIPQVIWRSL